MKSMYGLAIAIAAFLFTAAQTVGAQPPATPNAASWFARYMPDSRLVRIPGGRSLNLYCIGAGTPTVILEAGIGGSAFDWWPVQEQLAARSRVCAYDRAGSGRSPPGPFPRDTRAQVADLEALLRAAHLRPPYLLVGHSMGGFNVRLFATRHRREVAGMVLVDPSVENLMPTMHAAAPAIADNDARSLRRLRACADPQRSLEVAAHCTRPAPASFAPDLAASFVAQRGLASTQSVLSEVEAFLNRDSAEVAAERRPLGAMPLIILTRGARSSDLPPDQAETEWRLWNRMHDEMSHLSTIGSNRVVAGANHYIQNDRPAAVVEAIAEVAAAARRRGPSSR